MIEGLKVEIFSLMKYTWPTVMMAVIIAVLLRVTDVVINKKEFVFHEEILKLCFIVYILFLFYVVTFQDVSWSSHNLIPFKEIFRYEFGSGVFYKNIFGNMLLFLPYGIFISKYLKLDNKKIVFFIAFITSLSIETVQFLIGRVFDVDDIILNILGCFIGYYMYVIFKKSKDKLPDFMQKNIVWDILSIIVLGGLVWLLMA